MVRVRPHLLWCAVAKPGTEGGSPLLLGFLLPRPYCGWIWLTVMCADFSSSCHDPEGLKCLLPIPLDHVADSTQS